MSRAEWPVASTTASAINVLPARVVTPFNVLFVTIKSVTFCSNKNCPPWPIMASRIAVIICGSLLVPMCGWASNNIVSSAPNCTNKLRMRLISPRLLLRVYNLPSL